MARNKIAQGQVHGTTLRADSAENETVAWAASQDVATRATSVRVTGWPTRRPHLRRLRCPVTYGHTPDGDLSEPSSRPAPEPPH